jgi:hypothetical protein
MGKWKLQLEKTDRYTDFRILLERNDLMRSSSWNSSIIGIALSLLPPANPGSDAWKTHGK